MSTLHTGPRPWPLALSHCAQGLTVTCEPGVLTALMGGSGAGKTTLMDVIAGRKTQGEITGNILVNGHPKDQATWSRVMGYVEQVLLTLSLYRVCITAFWSPRRCSVRDVMSNGWPPPSSSNV